ncbi:MAG: (deoxy)nucleoside triphosphate pyrophosphohydrolase [Terriglobia bacterium]
MQAARPILVAAGILLAGDHVLICQRHRSDPYGLKWEFPGGKVNPREDLRTALARELEEELGIAAEIGEELFRVRHRYPDRFVEVVFFRVLAYQGEIQNRVFEKIEWAARNRLAEYPFLDADREIVQRLLRGEIA